MVLLLQAAQADSQALGLPVRVDWCPSRTDFHAGSAPRSLELDRAVPCRQEMFEGRGCYIECCVTIGADKKAFTAVSFFGIRATEATSTTSCPKELWF